MANATISGGKAQLDEKIEKFCEGSEELLANIHARCGDMNPGKPKEKRKKKAKKEKE